MWYHLIEVLDSIKPIAGAEKMKDKNRIAVLVSSCLHYHLKAHNVSLSVKPKYRRTRGGIYNVEKFDKELGMQRGFVLDSGDMQALVSKAAIAMGIKDTYACAYQFTDVMQRQFKYDCFDGGDIGDIFEKICDGIEIVEA
jgi:hypothetical protein